MKDDREKSLFNIDVGRRLFLCREAMGKKQNQLAEEFCMSNPSWTAYEAGRNTLPPRIAIQIKARYGFTTDWLYAGDMTGMLPIIRESLEQVIDRERSNTVDDENGGTLPRNKVFPGK